MCGVTAAGIALWLAGRRRQVSDGFTNPSGIGSFFSVAELTAAFQDFLAAWNENPKPFLWTATVDAILANLSRSKQTLEQIQPACTLPKARKRKNT